MSNFKYTKGKWQFVRYDKTFAIETFGITNWTILQTITNQPQDEANAKLIACAPEMLEMLELLTSVYSADNIEKAKQLIEKATE